MSVISNKVELGQPAILLPIIISVFCSIIAFATGKYVILSIPLLLPLVYILIFKLNSLYFLLAAALPVSFTIYIGSLGLEFVSEPLMIAICFIGFLYLIMNWNKIRSITIIHPISLLVIFLLLWTIISFLNSTHYLISLKYVLAKSWMIGAMFFGSLYYMRRLSHWKKFFWAMFSTLTIAVIIIMIRHAFQGFSYHNIHAILNPFFPNHVNYAAVLILFLPFMHLALSWYSKGSWQKRLLYGSIILYILAIFFSYTRAAYIVLLAYPFIYVMFKYKLSKIVLILTFIGSFVFYGKYIHDKQFIPFAPHYEKTIYHDQFGNLVNATYKFEDISTMERLYRWVAAYYMISDKPVLGFGPGTFYSAYKPYGLTMFSTYVSDNELKSTVHNYYLLLMIELGIPGLIIFLSIIVLTILLIEKLIHHQNISISEKRILYACGLSLIGFLMMSLINDLLEVDKISIFFYLSLAATAIISCKEFQTKK